MSIKMLGVAFFVSLLFVSILGEEWKCTSDFCLKEMQNVEEKYWAYRVFNRKLQMVDNYGYFYIYVQDWENSTPCPVINDTCTTYNLDFGILTPSPTICNCCNLCLLFTMEGKGCITGSPSVSLPNSLCGPNMECVNGYCRNKTELSIPDPLVEIRYAPDDNNKTYHCIDPITNTQIFGTIQKDSLNEHEQQCECSILAHRSKTSNNKLIPQLINQPVARCLSNGQFDPLQCFEGYCGCVDPATGAYDDSARRVSITSLSRGNPSCYNEAIHHPGYYNECELKIVNIMKEKQFAEADGDRFLFPYASNCNPDGNYA